jgi:hypothetical protein
MGADITPIDLTGGMAADITPLDLTKLVDNMPPNELINTNTVPLQAPIIDQSTISTPPTIDSQTILENYTTPMTAGGKKEKYKDFEYTDNVLSDYKNYIEKYERFQNEMTSKSNLKKYNYKINNGKFTKTTSSGKKIMDISQPNYIDIKTLMTSLDNDKNNILFELKMLRNEILLSKNLSKMDKFNKLKKEYIELLDFKDKVNKYYDEINKTVEKEMSLKELINNKIETKRTLQILLNEIKQANDRKESVHDKCIKYIEANNIQNIETQIRTLKETPAIDSIITYTKDKSIIDNSDDIPAESVDLNDSILNIETLNIENDNLADLEPEKDHEEISYYKNKPEVSQEDLDIPLSPIVVKEKKKKSLKKTLLKSTAPKKQKQKLKLKIVKGTDNINKTMDVKESNIDAINMSADGKKRKKVAGIPVKEGKCVFPFKNGDKYIQENDGCVKGKTGNWCATEVDKTDDYKIKSFGYCK